MKVVRLQTRNPLVALAVLLIVVAVVLLVLGLGVALLAGGAVIGGAALLGRRVLRLRRPPPPPLSRLDPSREIFASPTHEPTHDRSRDALPPGSTER